MRGLTSLIVILLALIGPAHADQTTPTERPTVAPARGLDYANIRYGPSTEFSIIDKLMAGQSATVIGRRDGWWMIEHGDDPAWIAASVVVVSGSVRGVPYVDDPLGGKRYGLLRIIEPEVAPRYNMQSCNMVRTGAICNDGQSSSATGSGACSSHGGVRQWIESCQ